jgi:hypothetical protein
VIESTHRYARRIGIAAVGLLLVVAGFKVMTFVGAIQQG